MNREMLASSNQGSTGEADLPRRPTVEDAIARRRTDLPLLCFRPDAAQRRAEDFARKFPGKALYAIKAQAEPTILKAIAAGLRAAGKPVAFDTASLPEIQLARSIAPDAQCFFMNPMKKKSWIKAAYELGVRHFVVDHPLEFQKFIELNIQRDAAILVRMATPPGVGLGKARAAYDLSEKFGAPRDIVLELLRSVSGAGYPTGIAFHVGSQFPATNPWLRCLDVALKLREESGVNYRYIDVGGGFPGVYAGMDAGAMQEVIDDVCRHISALKLAGVEFLAEPGRSIVFDSLSVVNEIIGRKDRTRMGHRARSKPSLYIDDGVWSLLAESLTADFKWPVRWFKDTGPSPRLIEYYIGGVTCDSTDVLAGEYLLPDTLGVGDLIEFGSLGAYSTATTSHFNGFGEHERVIVAEPFKPSR